MTTRRAGLRAQVARRAQCSLLWWLEAATVAIAAATAATMPARARISPGVMTRGEKLIHMQKIRTIWKRTTTPMIRVGFMAFTPGPGIAPFRLRGAEFGLRFARISIGPAGACTAARVKE